MGRMASPDSQIESSIKLTRLTTGSQWSKPRPDWSRGAPRRGLTIFFLKTLFFGDFLFTSFGEVAWHPLAARSIFGSLFSPFLTKKSNFLTKYIPRLPAFTGGYVVRSGMDFTLTPGRRRYQRVYPILLWSYEQIKLFLDQLEHYVFIILN